MLVPRELVKELRFDDDGSLTVSNSHIEWKPGQVGLHQLKTWVWGLLSIVAMPRVGRKGLIKLTHRLEARTCMAALVPLKPACVA